MQVSQAKDPQRNAFCLPWDERRLRLHRLPLEAAVQRPQEQDGAQGPLGGAQPPRDQHSPGPAAGAVRVAAFGSRALHGDLGNTSARLQPGEPSVFPVSCGTQRPQGRNSRRGTEHA